MCRESHRVGSDQLVTVVGSGSSTTSPAARAPPARRMRGRRAGRRLACRSSFGQRREPGRPEPPADPIDSNSNHHDVTWDVGRRRRDGGGRPTGRWADERRPSEEARGALGTRNGQRRPAFVLTHAPRRRRRESSYARYAGKRVPCPASRGKRDSRAADTRRHRHYRLWALRRADPPSNTGHPDPSRHKPRVPMIAFMATFP